MYSFLPIIAFAISIVVCTPVSGTTESATTGVMTAQVGRTTDGEVDMIALSTTETPQTESARTKVPDAVVIISTTRPDMTKINLENALTYLRSIGYRNANVHGDHIDVDHYVHITPTATVKPGVTTTPPEFVDNVSSGVGQAPIPLAVVIVVLFYYIM